MKTTDIDAADDLRRYLSKLRRYTIPGSNQTIKDGMGNVAAVVITTSQDLYWWADDVAIPWALARLAEIDTPTFAVDGVTYQVPV